MAGRLASGQLRDQWREGLHHAGRIAHEALLPVTEAHFRLHEAADHAEDVKDEAGRIARESMANGTAARVHVTAMESTGEKCNTEARPDF